MRFDNMRAMTRLLLAALMLAAPSFAFAQNAGGIPADVLRIVTPITVGDCLQVSKNTVPYAAADAGAPCGTGGGGGGTVTSFSFLNGNGFNGIVTNATTTPSLSLSPSFTGFAYSNGSSLSAASTTGSGNLVLANSPTLVTPNLGTPSAIDLQNGIGLPFSGITSGTLGSGVLTIGTGATLTYSGSGVLNANQIGSLNWPPPISGDCLTTNGTALLWGTCGGAGTSFEVNGTATAASNPINFLDSALTDGLTLTFANPSAGNVQLGLTGTLSTAGGGTGLTALTQYSLLSGGASTANLIAPSATVGEALISNGTAAQPGYSASLAGVTSVNGTTIPAASTLLYSGGALGTPSSGTLTNATGLPLSTGVTGILAIGNGGTGVSGTPTNGELLIGNGTGYALGAIQGSTNVTVTNGVGSISLALPATITSNTSGNAATATALATAPTQCSGAVATGIASSGNANCTPTPTLGASGTLGSVTFGNATSGTVTLEPVPGALGAVTASLPANTGTVAETNLAQTFSALQTFGTDISIGGVTPTGATGTGAVVFGTSPTLTTPNLGTPSAVVLTNGTGLPVSTGVAGLGTGVGTALGVNVGTAGSFVVNGGALGTPSSGVGTNITGVNAASVGGYTLPCTVPTLVSGDYLTNNGTTCSWSAGVTFQTNGTNNASQAALNLVGTGNVAVTNPTGGTVDIGPITESLGNGGAVVTASTYTVATTDCGTELVFENATSVAVSLPAATGSFAGCQIDMEVPSGYGTATVTPASGTIGGNSTVPIAANRQLTVNSAGGVWNTPTATALVTGGGSGTVNSGTLGQLGYYATTGTAISGTPDVSISGGAVTLGVASSVVGSLVLHTSHDTAIATITVNPLYGTNVTQTFGNGYTNFSSGVEAGYFLSSSNKGNNFTLGTSTGACATSSTLVGGASAGSFTCTGATGSSTITINLPTAVNGWSCRAHDITTPANALTEGANSTTTDTFSGTVTSNDSIRFGCVGY